MLRMIRAPRHVGVFLHMLVVMSASAAHGQTTTFTTTRVISNIVNFPPTGCAL